MNGKAEDSIKIALIEAAPADVARVLELVRTGTIPAEVSDAMSAERPDLEGAAIIFLGLDTLDEPERDALTRLHAGFPGKPIIVLAGPDAAPRGGEAVSLGAQYVISKSDLTAAKLSSLIRYYAGYAGVDAPPSAATA